MEIDNYTFYSPTLTETIKGKRVRKLMAVHKVTGETFFFSADEIDAMRQPNNQNANHQIAEVLASD